MARLSRWMLAPGIPTCVPSVWSNEDMDPVPPHLRTWATWDYLLYWLSDATNVGTWQIASSILTLGLSWRQAVPAIAIGYTIIAVVMVLNGTIGARLHISFPVLNRSSFGFWFSYFTVISRVVLSMFWFGIQTFIGSECVYQMLKASIWPSIGRFPNHLPLHANITTSGLICYLVYWLIQLPVMFVSPQRIRHLFRLKALVVPPTWLAMLIWAFVKVPSYRGLFTQQSTISGSKLSWAWLRGVNSAIGAYASLSVNIPDFTRYAINERAQYIQLLIIPVAFTFFAFAGIAVTSAGQILYGELLWDPLRLIGRWDNRAAAFFASFSFMLATLGTNVSANSLSAANDMMVLAPRWINMKRGQVICAVIGGLALVPWQILAKAAGFLAFVNGFTVFLGPFAGIMVTDYWLVHREQVDVPSMYHPHGRYRYIGGVNWRALLALVVSVSPLLPGLVHSIDESIEAGGTVYLFNVAWMFGFTVAASVYYVASAAFPAKETFIEEATEGKGG